MFPALEPGENDESRLWSEDSVALGRVVLPVLPQDSLPAPPIPVPQQIFCLAADLRLDNRDELARDLDLAHPETLCDSALLAAAWQRWGIECLDHLLGGFAFCIWDRSTRELFAARDHTGEYPLFFHRRAGQIAIASRASALRRVPGVAAEFDEQRIADWLLHAAPDPAATFFKHIERLPMGHSLRASAAGVETRQYWHAAHATQTRYRRDAEYADALADLLLRATEPRLRAAGGVASELSAGLDSASVTASAALLLGSRHQALKAYTAVPQPGFDPRHRPAAWIADESPAAAEVAAFYPNIEHLLLSTAGMELVSSIQAIGQHLDEPVLNAVNWLWSLAIQRDARQRGVGVLLQGAVGNITISYETIRPLLQMARHGNWIRFARTSLGQRAMGETSLRASARLFRSAFSPRARRSLSPHQSQQQFFEQYPIQPAFAERMGLRARLLQNELLAANDVEERSRAFEEFDPGPIYAASRDLTGVDLRDPTGDKRIWEFCLSIPPEQFVAQGLTRSLTRRAMRGRLPVSTLMRINRGLQGADWYLTVGRELAALRAQLNLVAQSPAVQRYLDLSRLHQLIDTFPGSGFNNLTTFHTSHLTLLRGTALAMFLYQHDPESPANGAPRTPRGIGETGQPLLTDETQATPAPGRTGIQ